MGYQSNYKGSEVDAVIAQVNKLEIENNTIPIKHGGTGATTATSATKNLQALSLSPNEYIIEDLDLNNYIEIGSYRCYNNASKLLNAPEYITRNAFTFNLYVYKCGVGSDNSGLLLLTQEIFVATNGRKFYRRGQQTSNGDWDWSEWITSQELGVATGLTPDTDIDKLTEAGRYECRSAQTSAPDTTLGNKIPTPIQSHVFSLEVFHYGGNNVAQKIIRGNGICYQRYLNSSPYNWSAWYSIYSTANTTDAANELKVYSLGGGTILQENDDLNNFTDIGNYRCNSSSVSKTLKNVPSYFESGKLFNLKVMILGDASYRMQEITSGGGMKFNRYKTNSDDWTDWHTSYSDQNLIPLEAGGTGSKFATASPNAIVRVYETSSGNRQLYFTNTNNGAFYATKEGNQAQFGTLPVPQGGTGQTVRYTTISAANIEYDTDKFYGKEDADYPPTLSCRYYPYLGMCFISLNLVTKTALTKGQTFILADIDNGYRPTSRRALSVWTSTGNFLSEVVQYNSQRQHVVYISIKEDIPAKSRIVVSGFYPVEEVSTT